MSHDREFECRAGASELCLVIQFIYDRGPESDRKKANLLTFEWAATKRVMTISTTLSTAISILVFGLVAFLLWVACKRVSASLIISHPLLSPILPFERLELELWLTWMTKCSSAQLMVPISSSSESPPWPAYSPAIVCTSTAAGNVYERDGQVRAGCRWRRGVSPSTFGPMAGVVVVRSPLTRSIRACSETRSNSHRE